VTDSSSDSSGSSDRRSRDTEPGSLRGRIEAELGRALVERAHGWRTPVLATVDAQGHPDARTVVLREFDPVGQTLCVYTDRRSPKLRQIAAQPRASLVFWSRELSWQLRVAARLDIEVDTPRVDSVWARLSTTPAARDYLSPAAPGEPLHAAPPGGADGHHLAILVARIDVIDWLELGRDRHRRAVFDASGASWRTP
jgi:pyridoxamine 5'-phosphate oxidase